MHFKSRKSFDLWLLDNAPNLKDLQSNDCRSSDNRLLIKKELIPVGSTVKVDFEKQNEFDYNVILTIDYISEEHDEIHNVLNQSEENLKNYKLVIK